MSRVEVECYDPCVKLGCSSQEPLHGEVGDGGDVVECAIGCYDAAWERSEIQLAQARTSSNKLFTAVNCAPSLTRESWRR